MYLRMKSIQYLKIHGFFFLFDKQYQYILKLDPTIYIISLILRLIQRVTLRLYRRLFIYSVRFLRKKHFLFIFAQEPMLNFNPLKLNNSGYLSLLVPLYLRNCNRCYKSDGIFQTRTFLRISMDANIKKGTFFILVSFGSPLALFISETLRVRSNLIEKYMQKNKYVEILLTGNYLLRNSIE